jgi:hypothetical protein
MNTLDILNLKPGTLFKGIDNSQLGKSILSVNGWHNNHAGTYGIRWFKESEISELDFDILNHRTLDLEQRFQYLQPTKTAKNGAIYIEKQANIMFDYKTVQIGDPIGLFLGESIFCSIGKLENVHVLLKILDVTNVGWIVLACSNMTSKQAQYDIM